jgi:hypothetical protein
MAVNTETAASAMIIQNVVVVHTGAENIRRLAEDRPLINQVDKDLGY